MGVPTEPLTASDGINDPQIIKQDNTIRAALAIIIFVGVIVFVCLASFYKSPLLPGDTLGMVLGLLLGWVSATVSYYYGSSSGSAVKTQQAAK